MNSENPSGIYKCTSCNNEVTHVKGKSFAPCPKCNNTNFKLVRENKHINLDGLSFKEMLNNSGIDLITSGDYDHFKSVLAITELVTGVALSNSIKLDNHNVS